MLSSGFKWMFLIIGTTIGAGYASGRELWQFFGLESGLAIAIFSILFSVSCVVIMKVGYQKKSTDYLPVLEVIVGKKLTKLYDVMVFVYLFTTTVVMLAGSGATGQAFYFSYWWGVGFIAVLLVLLFVRGVNSLLTINQFILPILLVGLLSVLVLFTFDHKLALFSNLKHQENWKAAFPFTALNILPLIAVLGAIGNKIQSQKEILVAGIGSGLTLGIVSYIYNNSLIQIAEEILVYEIPLFAILKHYNFGVLVFMSIMLWFAIFTTAASGILGLTTRIQSYWKSPLWVIALCCVTVMVPFTIFGFSTLISYIYPIYGVLNLYVLMRLILYPLWNNKNIA
ncbi:hypothetical protein [Virgibacillus sp. DJP39]|uniref:YkvI family membrane protein n=1 Tax=Virgibacillus sp. DJP39 TaxID=3409790 RepID=UPI003BB5F2E4